MIISIIVAADLKNGIGLNNQLLCHLPADLKYFKNLTTGHHILMGRKTYESIGRPLPNRTNIVLSKSDLTLPGCHTYTDLIQAIDFAKANGEKELFIIGGDNIYKQTIRFADKIYLTRILKSFEADAFFPELSGSDWDLTQNDCFKTDEKNVHEYCFQVYSRQV